MSYYFHPYLKSRIRIFNYGIDMYIMYSVSTFQNYSGNVNYNQVCIYAMIPEGCGGSTHTPAWLLGPGPGRTGCPGAPAAAPESRCGEPSPGVGLSSCPGWDHCCRGPGCSPGVPPPASLTSSPLGAMFPSSGAFPVKAHVICPVSTSPQPPTTACPCRPPAEHTVRAQHILSRSERRCPSLV